MKKQQERGSQRPKDMSIIDKIIVYGTKNPQGLKMSDITKNNIKVGILQIFNANDIKLQNTSANVKQSDQIYEMWVYPDGIKIYDSNLQIINDPEPQFSFFQQNIVSLNKIHNSKQQNIPEKQNKFLFYQYNYTQNHPPEYLYSFVLTDYELNRTYCTCLTWNEKKFVQNDLQASKPLSSKNTSINLNKSINSQKNNISNIYSSKQKKFKHSQQLPKCTIQQLIQDPLILDVESSMVYIPKGIIVCSKFPFLTFQKQILYFFYTNIIKKSLDVFIRSEQIQKFKNLVNKYGYPQAQKIFDQQEFLNQKQSESKKHIKQLPLKPSKIRSKKTMIKKQLQKRYQNQNSKHLKQINKQKLQDFYLSFMFLPELNSKFNDFLNYQAEAAIKIEIENSLFENFKFSPLYFSSKTCFKVPNISIIDTINKAGVDNILTIWKNALVQKQILIFSSDQNFTIQLCETILYLLEPLKWQNIYIPFLPFHLYHHVDALGGYLIGMSKIHMNYMIQHFNMQNKVLVDLDQMIIIEEGGTNIIQIPKSIKNWMMERLIACGLKTKQVSGSIFSLNSLNISKYFLDQESASSPTTFLPKIDIQERSHLIIFQIQKIFLEGILYLLNNYSSFISLVDNRVHLERQKYLQIFPDQEWKTFVNEVYKTMMFIRLCEFHLSAQKQLMWNQKNFYGLFVYCHLMITQQQKSKTFWPFSQEKQQSQTKIMASDLSSTKYIASNSVKSTISNPSAYISYVLKKNLKQIMAMKQTYKVEHYLVKYLSFLQLQRPGVIKQINKKVDKNSQGWSDWIWSLIQKKQIKQKKHDSKIKKQNKKNDFGEQFSQIVNLNNIFEELKEQDD